MTKKDASPEGNAPEFNIDDELEKITQEESEKIETKEEEPVKSWHDTKDSTQSAKPKSKHENSEDDAFSDLLGEKTQPPQKTKEELRKESAQKTFESFTSKLLKEEKDFYEMSPWIQKGVINTLLEQIDNNEIELDDLPEEVQEKILKKLENREALDKKPENKEKTDSGELDKRVKIAELRILSKEIPKDLSESYFKAVKGLLTDMPKASAEKIDRYAKIEIGFDPNGNTRGINIRPTKLRSGEKLSSENMTEGAVKNSSDSEFLDAIFGNR